MLCFYYIMSCNIYLWLKICSTTIDTNQLPLISYLLLEDLQKNSSKKTQIKYWILNMHYNLLIMDNGYRILRIQITSPTIDL